MVDMAKEEKDRGYPSERLVDVIKSLVGFPAILQSSF